MPDKNTKNPHSIFKSGFSGAFMVTKSECYVENVQSSEFKMVGTFLADISHSKRHLLLLHTEKLLIL